MLSPKRLFMRSRGATGAIGAQLAQALASLVLSIAAARSLGADGLGVFGLLSGGITLVTALSTGLVGDSLTVLDRGAPKVRSGLQIVGLGVAALAGIASTVVCAVTGLLSWPVAVAFGVASAAFMIEDYLRRLLMATLKFWSVLIVDLSALAVTIAWLVGADLIGTLSMMQIVLAILASQIIGFVVAAFLLPSAERHFARFKRGEIVSVLRFGSWRSAQQVVRPGMLTLMRILVVVAVSTVAYGELEAARVYTAPTLLMVNGIGSFLFATYAAERHHGLSPLVKRADRGAVSMFVAVLFAGVVAVVLLPYFGKIVSGGKFDISALAVFGWVLYSATAAVLMPYGSLAAVSGMHVKVFNFRLLEAAISLASVGVVLFVFHASASWTPFAMALGPIVLGLVIRQYILLPAARKGLNPTTGEVDAQDPEPGDGPTQNPATSEVPSTA
jgi:O-antigen/teichoic acid export membrane protein